VPHRRRIHDTAEAELETAVAGEQAADSHDSYRAMTRARGAARWTPICSAALSFEAWVRMLRRGWMLFPALSRFSQCMQASQQPPLFTW
jgi:hypothetical protein